MGVESLFGNTDEKRDKSLDGVVTWIRQEHGVTVRTVHV